MSKLRHKFHRKQMRELEWFDKLIKTFGDLGREETIGTVKHNEYEFPLKVFHIGSTDKTTPVILLTGAVHGLEKVGSDVILSYLETLSQLYKWDQSFKERMKHSRIIFFPVVNPFGIFYRTRSNANGVDLMRNSPLDAESKSPYLFCGHRKSNKLPWYRGQEGAPMEVEAQALCDLVERELFPAVNSVAIDVHSGFGVKDRLWFPYAFSKKPFPYLAEIFNVKSLFDATYTNHFYQIEPVSSQYAINGDLWDHMMLKYESLNNKVGSFIPLTLEMGSWSWIKKNPMQLLLKYGIFHPVKEHRYKRIMRRHKVLFDFIHRILVSPKSWNKLSGKGHDEILQEAYELWYPKEYKGAG